MTRHLPFRGRGMLRDESEIAQVVLRTEPNGTPVLVKQVATVKIAPAPRYGVVTHNGEGEAVTGIVMMLIGSNSRDVIHAVHARLENVVKPSLPPGVQIESVYDRADFVGRTLSTVATNLIEGVLVVTPGARADARNATWRARGRAGHPRRDGDRAARHANFWRYGRPHVARGD